MDHSFSLHFLQKREHDEAVVLCFFFWGSTKTQKAFILIHSSFKIIARALLPVCIYLALKTTHHTATDRREKRSFLAIDKTTFTRAREQTLLARLFFFFSLVLWTTPIGIKKGGRAHFHPIKRAPPRKTTPFFLLC